MPTRIPLSEFEQRCSDVVLRAGSGEEFEITIDGRPCAVLLPAEPLEPRTRVPVASLGAKWPRLPADETLRGEIDVDGEWCDDDPFAGVHF